MPAPSNPLRPFSPTLRRWLPWIAGAVALGLAAALTVSWTLRDSTPAFSEQLRTGAADMRALSLPDGSEVSLNHDTALAVAYFPRRRDVTLAQGEAFFQVRWQYRTAFNVRIGPDEINIVGTQVEAPPVAFNVEAAAQMFKVQVRSGSLKVRTATAGPREFVEMRAGDALVVWRAQHRHELTRVEPSTVGAWTPSSSGGSRF